VLGAELEKAQASGKKRVTAGSMKGPSIPKPRLEAVHTASRNLIASLDSIDEDSRSLTIPTALVLQLREALDGAKPR
jgi:ParB family chromosome partitioning protein